MEEFECICGNNKKENFTYVYTMADGEIWNCDECKDDIVVEFQEDED